MLKKIGLGTVQFGMKYGVANSDGPVESYKVNEILKLAERSGIGLLDTAIAYGTSEQILGEIGVDGFRLVTKLPALPEDQINVTRWVTKQVCESLARLGKKNLYGLLLHRSEDFSGSKGEQLVQALVGLKDDGIIQKIGVSIYSPNELDVVCKKIRIDLVQAPLNVIDRRLQFSGWLDRLKDNGVEVHTRSAFLQGLLLMKRSAVPQKFSRWSRLWDQWYEKLRATGVSPLEACLAYPLSLEQVDQIIVGVDSAAQLLEILRAAKNVNEEHDTSFMHSTDLDLINPFNWEHL